MSYGRGDDDGVTSGVAPGDTSGDTTSGTGGDGSGTRFGEMGGVCSGAIPRGDTPAGRLSSGEFPGCGCGCGAVELSLSLVALIVAVVAADDDVKELLLLLRKRTGTLLMLGADAAAVAGDVWCDGGLFPALPGPSGGSVRAPNLCGNRATYSLRCARRLLLLPLLLLLLLCRSRLLLIVVLPREGRSAVSCGGAAVALSWRSGCARGWMKGLSRWCERASRRGRGSGSGWWNGGDETVVAAGICVVVVVVSSCGVSVSVMTATNSWT